MNVTITLTFWQCLVLVIVLGTVSGLADAWFDDWFLKRR